MNTLREIRARCDHRYEQISLITYGPIEHGYEIVVNKCRCCGQERRWRRRMTQEGVAMDALRVRVQELEATFNHAHQRTCTI